MKKNEKFLLAADSFYKDENRTNYDEMMNSLLETSFIVPVKGFNSSNKKINKESIELKNDNLFFLYNESGQSFIPVFTDKTEMKKWNKKELSSFSYNLEELEKLVGEKSISAEGITINAFSHNLSLDFNKLRTIMERRGKEFFLGVEVNKEREERKYLGLENEIDLNDELVQFFKKDKTISEVYAVHMTGYKEDKILIFISGEASSDLNSKLKNIVKSHLKACDFELITESSRHFSYVHKIKNRIYKRKRFLFF